LPLPSARPVGSVPAPRFLSCFALPHSRKRSQKLTPLIPHASALLKKEHPANSSGISSFRTLLQITGGGTLLDLFCFNFELSTVNFFRIRISEKQAHNPFRIRSFKTRHLKPFRMRSFKKRARGAPSSIVRVPRSESPGANHSADYGICTDQRPEAAPRRAGGKCRNSKREKRNSRCRKLSIKKRV
jgi:hypothetical protein